MFNRRPFQGRLPITFVPYRFTDGKDLAYFLELCHSEGREWKLYFMSSFSRQCHRWFGSLFRNSSNGGGLANLMGLSCFPIHVDGCLPNRFVSSRYVFQA